MVPEVNLELVVQGPLAFIADLPPSPAHQRGHSPAVRARQEHEDGEQEIVREIIERQGPCCRAGCCSIGTDMLMMLLRGEVDAATAT